MTKPQSVEIEQLNQFIDQAIDSLFVPRSQRQPPPEAPPELQADPSEPPVVEEPPPEPSALETTEISWDQPASEAPQAPEAEEEDAAPRHPALRKLHEALLSLDWEINNENIAALETRIGEFKAQFPQNAHVEAVTKLGLITCKYLKASKSVATPLAPRFLREMIYGCDVFLAGRGGPGKSPDALMNDLLGLYNDMKLDANRLRATELKRREDRAESPAPSAAPAAPPPAAPSAVVAAAEPRAGAGDLRELLERMRELLRAAATRGAPYAVEVDTLCVAAQERLQSATDLPEGHSCAAALAPVAQSAQELSRALARFQEELRLALKTTD